MIDNICFVMLNVIKNCSKWVSFVDIVIRYLACVFFWSLKYGKRVALNWLPCEFQRAFSFSLQIVLKLSFLWSSPIATYFFHVLQLVNDFHFFCSRKCNWKSKEKTLLRLSNNRNVHKWTKKINYHDHYSELWWHVFK